MNNDFDKDNTHEKLIQAFLRYLENNQKFELYGYERSSIRARHALSDIGKMIKPRRQEIWERKLEMHGHKRKGIEPTNPSERRQRKIDRAAQKRSSDSNKKDN